MKILWVKSDFLHPTTRGGQIRTLEMLRRLHGRHEIHYVAFEDPRHPEGRQRAGEYCSRAYPIAHHVPPRRSAQFALQLIKGLWTSVPVSIDRYRSSDMHKQISALVDGGAFDSVVCDFLTPAINFSSLRAAVLFQHNVETIIWDRHAETATNPLGRSYLRGQARRMREFEDRTCRDAGRIVAVSESDAHLMQTLFGVSQVSPIPTGVDVDYFRPNPAQPVSDLVFVGSMDWLPNIDGIRFFVDDVLPLIRRVRPDCSLTIVGRNPAPSILALAARDPAIHVTGTVDDVRPFLWGTSVSVVPLRIGGGTRLKIYEAMAARTAVVSTTIGAEGLHVTAPDEIRLADTADEFAAQCLDLLSDPTERQRMSRAAFALVASTYSWDAVVSKFEAVLEGFAASGSRLNA